MPPPTRRNLRGTAGEQSSPAVPRFRWRLLQAVAPRARRARRPQDPGSRGSGGAARSRAYPLDPVKSRVPSSSPFRCGPRVDKDESPVPASSSIHFNPRLDRGASPVPALADSPKPRGG